MGAIVEKPYAQSTSETGQSLRLTGLHRRHRHTDFQSFSAYSSSLIPVSCTTLPQRAVSLAMWLRSCSGLLPTML